MVSGPSAHTGAARRARPGGRWPIPLACVALYLVAVLWLGGDIVHRNDGVFTYSLDDPYIHLALAKNLAHGHYGINPGELSSPSSSILWPFLLVPFAGRPWHMYLPLLLNVLFCGLSAGLIGRTVAAWDWGEPDPSRARPERHWTAFALRFGVAAALMLVANLAGLTFVGMEHGLQVLLTIACAVGMLEALRRRRIPAWCLVAAVLGPLVRYESFALVAAICVALWAQGRLRAAALLAGGSLVGPAIFSGFLLSRGLAALPSSVLVKGSVYGAQAPGALAAVIAWTLRRIQGDTLIDIAPQLALTLLLLALVAKERVPLRRRVLGGVALVEVLHVAVGRYGWFHRYESYALIFGGMVVAAVLAESKRMPPLSLIGGLVLLGTANLHALWATPQAASNIYQQQYQMQRFEAHFYRGNVALNDLGWVGYRRPPGVYILDLAGLASPEAAKQRVKDAAWLDAVTREHGAGLAMVYPEWIGRPPADWMPLGTMCMTAQRVSAAYPCVVFYRTGVGDGELLQRELAAFTRTLPPSVHMTLGKDLSLDEEDEAP
jgi:hypothetical protein